MDNINEPHSKLSYEELLEQNNRLKNQVQEINKVSKKELNRYNKTDFHKVDLGNNIDFHDIFDINEIQRIQDLFAEATGVASIITYPNGIPITKPSNFSRLCIDIIRKTEKGLKNCYYSDAEIGKQNIGGAICQPCLSGGLWDGGASITVGGKHIANWLIGQVKDENFDENKMLLYAKEIGADETEFKKALDEVSVMSTEKFKKIADTLFFFANEISQKAYQNTSQNRLITELQEKEEQLIKAKEIAEQNELKFKALYHESPDMYVSVSPETSNIILCNNTFLLKTGYSRKEIIGAPIFTVYHQDSIEEARKTFETYKKEGSINNKELILQKKNGDKIYVSLNVTSIRDTNGKILYSMSSWRDISERIKLRAKQLRDTQLLNETGRLAKIGGWELDVETMTLYFSQETKHIYGFSKDTSPYVGIGLEYYPEEAHRTLNNLVQDAIEKGKPYDVELPFINEQGKHLWVRTIGIPEKKDGKVSRLYGTLQDITEQKHAQKSLHSSQEMLLSSQSVANICSYSTNLIITEIDKSQWECSPEFYKIFGIDETYPHTIEGWIGFLHPAYRDDVAAYHESVVLEKKSFNLEYKIIRINDGVERWVHGTGELVYDEKGNPIRMHGAIQDITERKQAELTLKESEWYLEKAQGVSKTGHYIWDLKNSISTWSNKMFNIFGVKQENGTPTPEEYLNFIHEDDKHMISPEYLEMIFQKPNHEMQFKIIDQSTNDVKHVYLWGETIFNNTGEPVRAIGVIQDITKQKNTEFELIKAKEKAEESDRLKSAFLANMSHEIRTPMNGILGFTELLQDVNLSGENQKDYINIIKKSGDRLLNTVDDIIEISKIESGDINVIKSKVDIIGHLNTLVTFFKTEAEKKSLEIVVRNNIEGNSLFIHTDKNKLDSILSNLIKNAIKYTNEGTIKVVLEVENNQVLFSCQDTGIGIPESRQEAVFNRFEQADIEDKHALQGSGLGLAIVKSYVEVLGGKIWVESEEGNGSVFYVSLPYNAVRTNEENLLSKENSSDIRKKNINVLIVEDDEFSSMHLSIVTKSIVKNVTCVENGIEAVDTCKNDSSIDLVLMDMKMPKMDGFEATKRIREFNRDVIIIAQTAHAFAEDKQKVLDAGCDDFISKPIQKDKLAEIINKYF